MTDRAVRGELMILPYGLGSLEDADALRGTSSGRVFAQELRAQRHEALQPAQNLLDRDLDVITPVHLRDGGHLTEEHCVVALDCDGSGNGHGLVDIDDQAFALHLDEGARVFVLRGRVGRRSNSNDD